MKTISDHPVISEMERFGYLRQGEYPEDDEDRAYEEARDREHVEDGL